MLSALVNAMLLRARQILGDFGKLNAGLTSKDAAF